MKNCLIFLLIFSFSLTPIPNRNLRGYDSFTSDSQKLAPSSSFVAIAFEQSLLTEAGTPYSVYGVFGVHKTEYDGRARVEQIKKIFDLARKTNKKIIFFREETFGDSIEVLKEFNPEISQLNGEDLFNLSEDPKKVYLLKSYLKDSFTEQRKFLEEQEKFIKENERILVNFQNKMNATVVKLRQSNSISTVELIRQERLLEKMSKELFDRTLTEMDYYQKEIYTFLNSNRDITEKIVKEREVLGMDLMVEYAISNLKYQGFLKKVYDLLDETGLPIKVPLLKKAISFRAQGQLLRDKGVAEWIQQNRDDNKIIVYDRGTAHAYYGVLEKTLGEKHKMIFVDTFVGKMDKKIMAQSQQIIDNENVLNTPENEILILKYIGFVLYSQFLLQEKREQRLSLREPLLLEAEKIIDSLTRQQTEGFIKQFSIFILASIDAGKEFHIQALEWLRSQKQNHLPLSQPEPCEIAL